MKIILVSSVAQSMQFLQLPVSLYKNDPNYIQPLNKDVEEVFDPEKNKSFRFGKLERWLLQNADGKYIGRIAAFVNKKYKNKGDEGAVGGIGFFECINDQAAADLLFDTAKKWLEENGMEAMDGPINFGERDRWWGLVTKGFMEPMYCMNYNPPFYEMLFKNYGFKEFFTQVCFDMDPKAPLEQKVWDRHDKFSNDPAFSARHIKKKDLEKASADFATVYNAAWAGHGGMKQMDQKQVLKMFQKMKPVMDERLIWFAYHKGEPISMFVNLPDLNQWFKHLHGKFGLLQKLKFLWLQKFKPNKKFTGIVFGVVPQWQGKGIDSFMIAESAKLLQQPSMPYERYEMQWIGDFNPKMINIAASIGDVKRSRELKTMRFLFDRNKEFKRHPILG